MIEEHDGDEGIMAIFLAEAEEIVRRLAGQLAELKYGYDGQRILDDIHRGFHTLYGGARVLELASLAELSLLSAEVMQRLRARRIPLNPGLIALIVEAVDALAALLSAAQAGDRDGGVPEELADRLMEVSGRSRKLAEPSIRPAPDSDAALSTYFSAESEADESTIGRTLQPQRPRPAASTLAAGERLGALPNFSREGASWWQGPESLAVESDSAMAERRIAEELRYFSHELNWVRDLMLRLQDGGSREEKRRAIEYLDLLARDVQRWSDRLPVP